MGVLRESIVRGPGSVTLGTQQFYDKDGINAVINMTTFDVPVSAFGNVDTRRSDAVGEISFTPCGRINAGILAAMFPYHTPHIGAEIFGSSDTAAVVHSLAGKKVVFHAAAITGMPSLRLSATQTVFGGPATIGCVLANGADRITANSMYTVSTEAHSGAFDKADIKCKPGIAAWGASTPWDAIRTKDGWTIDFDVALEPVMEDVNGTIGMQLTGVTVRAKCQPLGLSEAHVLDGLKVQGAGNALGDSIRTGNDLVIPATGGLTVTINDAALVEGPLAWGTTTLRAGELGWVAHRTITDGVGGPLFAVAMTA